MAGVIEHAALDHMVGDGTSDVPENEQSPVASEFA